MPYLLILPLLTFLASWVLTGLVRDRLLRRAIMDVPNARSMHKTPVPRGGGLAVMATILGGIALFALVSLPITQLGGYVWSAQLADTLVYPALVKESALTHGPVAPKPAAKPPSLTQPAPQQETQATQELEVGDMAVPLGNTAKTEVALPLLILVPALLLLMFVSWLDDRHGAGILVRLGAQFVAAAIGSCALGLDTTIFGDALPFWLDRAAMIVGWVWFMNLTNFMDGIDGISGVETICVAAGAALLFWVPTFNFVLAPDVVGDMALGLMMAGACGGFLILNWYPAKIFLGDVGSVPLGFLMAYLLLKLAALGYLAAALILPLYYLADSGITITRRALKGEKIWQPHRQHFYQRAAAGEDRHDKVARRILFVNILLIGLAGGAAFEPWAALGLAVLVVALLLFWMHKSAQKRVVS